MHHVLIALELAFGLTLSHIFPLKFSPSSLSPSPFISTSLYSLFISLILSTCCSPFISISHCFLLFSTYFLYILLLGRTWASLSTALFRLSVIGSNTQFTYKAIGISYTRCILSYFCLFHLIKIT